MPLNPAGLQTALLEMSVTNMPPNGTAMADRIADAYRQYALPAMAGAFALTTPGPGSAAMQQTLGAALSLMPGNPATVAQGYVAMLVAYWTGAVFTATPAPGVAAPPVGSPALLAAVTSLLSLKNPAEVYAATLATALHTCTLTVLVTFPQTPPTPPVILPVV